MFPFTEVHSWETASVGRAEDRKQAEECPCPHLSWDLLRLSFTQPPKLHTAALLYMWPKRKTEKGRREGKEKRERRKNEKNEGRREGGRIKTERKSEKEKDKRREKGNSVFSMHPRALSLIQHSPLEKGEK